MASLLGFVLDGHQAVRRRSLDTIRLITDFYDVLSSPGTIGPYSTQTELSKIRTSFLSRSALAAQTQRRRQLYSSLTETITCSRRGISVAWVRTFCVLSLSYPNI